MKVGDLVRLNPGGPGRDMIGFIMRIDKQHFGSNTAIKVSSPVRGHGLVSNMVDVIAKTADGIQDRILVLWNDETGWEYCTNTELEVVSESR